MLARHQPIWSCSHKRVSMTGTTVPMRKRRSSRAGARSALMPLNGGQKSELQRNLAVMLTALWVRPAKFGFEVRT